MPKNIRTYRPPGPSARSSYERMPSRREDIAFYQSPPWRKLRSLKLDDNPLCEPCLKRDVTVQAEHVHHILDRKERPDLALDYDNLESVCRRCHNAKRRRS